MLALPPAAPPAPQRQLLFGTALASAAGATLIGGMLALWLRFRNAAIDATGNWVPKKIVIPGAASNFAPPSLAPMSVSARWGVFPPRRDDRSHAALALFL